VIVPNINVGNKPTLVLPRQRGAALLAVLVVAVIMVMLMGVASTMLESRLSLAQDAKQQFREQIAVYSKQNELIYLLATQRITAAGVSQGSNDKGFLRDHENHWLMSIIGDEIRTDGYLTKAASGLTFSIQNEAGLLPINSSGQYWLKVWLKANVHNSRERVKYSDTLADYADPDDERRPAGAEKGDYNKGGTNNVGNNKRGYNKKYTTGLNNTFLPANFLLQNCHELWRVPGWSVLLSQFPSLISHCSLRRSGALNMNAIPLTLWRSLWPNSVVRVEKLREQKNWFLTDSAIFAAQPSIITVPDDYYSYLGGQTFRLKVQVNKIRTSIHLKRGLGVITPYTIRQ
jgi:general secretion pathway protein K